MTTGHPDFDALSAHLDGEAPEWHSHVAGCAACQATLARLRTVSALVADPPMASSPARERALSGALEAFAGGETHQEAVERSGFGPRAEAGITPRPVPPMPPRPRPEPVTPITAGRRRWRSGSGVWVGVGSAAALVMAFLVGMGVLAGGGGQHEHGTFAAGEPPAEESTTDLAGEAVPKTGDAVGALGDGAVGGGDLGDIADGPTLAARAGPGLAQRNGAPSRAGSTAGATTGTDSGIAGVSGNITEAPGATLLPATPAVTTRPCEIVARTDRPELGTVVYYATGRVGGVTVVVLGFAPGPAPAPVTLLALAPAEGCRVVLEAAVLEAAGP